MPNDIYQLGITVMYLISECTLVNDDQLEQLLHRLHSVGAGQIPEPTRYLVEVLRLMTLSEPTQRITANDLLIHGLFKFVSQVQFN